MTPADLVTLAQQALAATGVEGESSRKLLARAYLDLVRVIDAERGYGHDTSPADAVRFLGNLYRDLLHGAFACAQRDLEATYAELEACRAQLAEVTAARDEYRAAATRWAEAYAPLAGEVARLRALLGECRPLIDVGINAGEVGEFWNLNNGGTEEHADNCRANAEKLRDLAARVDAALATTQEHHDGE